MTTKREETMEGREVLTAPESINLRHDWEFSAVKQKKQPYSPTPRSHSLATDTNDAAGKASGASGSASNAAAQRPRDDASMFDLPVPRLRTTGGKEVIQIYHLKRITPGPTVAAVERQHKPSSAPQVESTTLYAKKPPKPWMKVITAIISALVAICLWLWARAKVWIPRIVSKLRPRKAQPIQVKGVPIPGGVRKTGFAPPMPKTTNTNAPTKFTPHAAPSSPGSSFEMAASASMPTFRTNLLNSTS
ncbi:hypothetical protein Pelo_2982 [Pelomyxa schiedti]|nr:hypothetical protein Pelo_2982 [Pelomyxa schiedti]